MAEFSLAIFPLAPPDLVYLSVEADLQGPHQWTLGLAMGGTSERVG